MAHRKKKTKIRLDPPKDWSPPQKLIVVATFYRTGSNHLCDLMASTGRLGIPKEYLFPRGPHMQSTSSVEGFDTHRFFTDIAPEWETQNGVAAIKLFPSHIGKLLDHVVLNRWFSDIRFIWLQRADTLGQAVSLALAGNNDDWFEHQTIKTAGKMKPTLPNNVEFALKGICDGHAFWSEFFARNDITPLLVSYEELAKNPTQVVTDIAQFCDVQLPSNLQIKSKFKRRAHEQNQSLREAFLKNQIQFGPIQSPAAAIFPRTMSNLVRFIKNKELRKWPK